MLYQAIEGILYGLMQFCITPSIIFVREMKMKVDFLVLVSWNRPTHTHYLKTFIFLYIMDTVQFAILQILNMQSFMTTTYNSVATVFIVVLAVSVVGLHASAIRGIKQDRSSRTIEKVSNFIFIIMIIIRGCLLAILKNLSRCSDELQKPF